MQSIVIVGAGECGVRAAFALREAGFEGSVTLIGAETVLPYERPPLSKDIQAPPKLIRSLSDYADAGIDLRLGLRVVALDAVAHQVQLDDGTVISFDQLLLATGARARLFPGMEGCLTLRSDADMRRIAQHLIPGARIGIIGGGFIGLELAATARGAGAEVSVIEAAPRLLGRAIPAEIASVVHGLHAQKGVRLLTSTDVAQANATQITLGDGTELDFDAVIAGVGAVPNTEIAQEAGLHVENGIVVDAGLRTSARDIFAAGDCCNIDWRATRMRFESWKIAQDQGAHAAAVLMGGDASYAKVPWFWSDQYDLTLQVAGVFDLTRPIHRRETQSGTCIVVQCDRDGRLSAAAGIGPGNATAKDLRVLEKLIEREMSVDPAVLVDPALNLKALLKAR